MKILIDMCLSPTWIGYFASQDLEAEHWSTVGDPKASDRSIMDFACAQDLVLFTHDLDFGSILAATHAMGPSVIQVRTEDPVPEAVGVLVASAIVEHDALLRRGALITVEPDRMRVRILPIVPNPRE